MRNPVVQMVLGILLSVALCISLFFEVRAIFNTVYTKHYTDLDKISQLSMSQAREAVHIDAIANYDEVSGVSEDGDVLKLIGFKSRIRINGTITDTTDTNGYYTYTSFADSQVHNLTVEEKFDKVAEFYNALEDYWHNESQNLLTALNVENIESAELEFFQSTCAGMRVPVIHSSTTENWYMFVPVDDQDSYVFVTCHDPIVLTSKQATAHFGDPSVNYQDKHTYSLYEEWATTATIKELMSEEGARTKKGLKENEYVDKDKTAVTADNGDDLRQLREEKAKIGTLKFNSSGKSEDGTKLDISSNDAKKSQWELSSDTFYYTANGLAIYTLSAKRSKEVFKLSGTIENKTSGKHPYVIIVKYLDEKGKLLGVKAIDKRKAPLKAGESTEFGVDVAPAHDGIQISNITSVMFELY